MHFTKLTEKQRKIKHGRMARAAKRTEQERNERPYEKATSVAAEAWVKSLACFKR